MRMRGLFLIALTCCGGVAVSDETPCDGGSPPAVALAPAAVEAEAPRPAPTANPACIETDESIETCIEARAASSWTAPETCMRADRTPDIPQKRNARGAIVARDGRKCCGYVRVEGIVALCCADKNLCLGPE